MSGFVPPPPPPPACVIRGSDDITAMVSSAESGGVTLARVSGFADWEMLALSGSSESGRVRVRWSASGMKLEGWVDAENVTFRAKHDLPLVPGHVWINVGASLRVRPEGSSATVSPLETAFANISTTVRCDELRIGEGSVEPVLGAPSYWSPSLNTLSLYAAPKGKLVSTLSYANTLRPQPYAAMEQRDGFLHVVHYEGVHLDGWVKAIEMHPWTGDAPQPPFVCGLGTLAITLDKKGPVRSVTEDTDVFVDASGEALKVGTLERGAHVRIGAGKKGYVEVNDEGGIWNAPNDHKLWVRTTALTP